MPNKENPPRLLHPSIFWPITTLKCKSFAGHRLLGRVSILGQKSKFKILASSQPEKKYFYARFIFYIYRLKNGQIIPFVDYI